MPSIFYNGVPVTQYSPVVFDAFANQTKVCLSFGLLRSEVGL